MKQIEFSVSLDPNAPPCLDDAVTFETGASIQQVRDPATFAYNHHGPGFLDVYPGALTVFFEDLVLGRPLPVRFVAHRIEGMDTVVAMALFMHRELAIEPRTPGFVAQVDFLHRRGLTVVGHVDRDVEQMVVLLNDGPEKSDPEWLQRAIGWVREYLLTGSVPGTVRPMPVRVIDRGTNGFVVATTSEPHLLRPWIELYRLGFLRGVVFGEDVEGRRQVLVSRKSPFVELDLLKAAAILNEMEAALQVEPSWTVEGLWLSGPPRGTLLLPEHVLQVLIRM